MINANTGPDYQSRLNLEREQQAQQAQDGSSQRAQSEDEKILETETPMPRAEVMALINTLVSFVKDIAREVGSKADADIQKTAQSVLANIASRNYQDKVQVMQLAKDAVGPSLYGFDSDPLRKTGDTLKLVSGIKGATSDQVIAAPGAVGGGLSALGNQVLYKGVFLREYVNAVPAVVVNGVTITPAIPQTIVPPGSEINPSDYGSVADYTAALKAAKHSLQYTVDWLRSGMDVQSP